LKVIVALGVLAPSKMEARLYLVYKPSELISNEELLKGIMEVGGYGKAKSYSPNGFILAPFQDVIHTIFLMEYFYHPDVNQSYTIEYLRDLQDFLNKLDKIDSFIEF